MAYLGNSSVNTQNITPATDFFSGNGVTTAFTLSRSVISTFSIEAVINNVQQNPSTAYTVSGNVITFTSAPPTGTNNIYVKYNSIIGQQIGIGQGTVGTSQLAAVTNIFSGVSNFTLQTGGNNTTALIVDQNQNVGLGGVPGTYNLNPKLFVSGPWSTPTATGSYGGVFVTTNDAVGVSANRGGTVSLGGVYTAVGDYTRFAAIAGNKNNSTDGDYGGYLAFFTRPNGAPPVERMRISSEGWVTTAVRPMFYVGFNGVATGPTTTIIPTGGTVQYNVGNHFNTSTMRFLVPVAGTYIFVGSYLKSASAICHRANVYKNGGVTSTQMRATEGFTGYNDSASLVTIVQCAVGDLIDFRLSSDSAGSVYTDGGSGYSYNHFSGVFLG